MAGGMVDFVTLGPQAPQARRNVDTFSSDRDLQQSKLFLNSITCHDLDSNPALAGQMHYFAV